MSNEPKQKIPSTPEAKPQPAEGTADLQKVWFTNPVQFGTTSKQRHWLSIDSSGAMMATRLEEHVKSLTLVGSLQCVLAVMRDDAKVDAKREFLIPLSVISHMLVKQ